MEPKNYIIHGYSEKPIHDLHLHSHVQLPVNQSLEIFRNIMEHFNYDKIAINTLPSYGVIENEKGFFFKANIPGVYLNVGPVHRHDSRDTADGYLEQIKTYYAMGCDGIKILDGKPDRRLKLGKRLDDPIFDKFYSFAEENGLPVLMHLGDPPQWWHEDTCPQVAKDRGWYYADPKYTPFWDTVREVEGILTKFPGLKLTLAHFFFMADNLPYLEEFFEKWQNTSVDITPGGEMFRHFSSNYENARKFFEKYSHRILYGTDIYNWEQSSTLTTLQYSWAVNWVRTFLEKSDVFNNPHATWVSDTPMKPFAFGDDVLDKIYRDNFTRILGEKPRPLDFELIAHRCQKCIETESLTELDTENMQKVIQFFKER